MMPFHRDAAVHIHLVAARELRDPMMVALRLHRTAVVMVVMALQARHQSYGDHPPSVLAPIRTIARPKPEKPPAAHTFETTPTQIP